MTEEVYCFSVLTSRLTKNPYSAFRRNGCGLFYFSVAVLGARFTAFRRLGR